MKVRVRLFAVAKQIAGADHVILELPAGSRVAELRAALAAKCPALASILAQLQFAIGSEYAGDEQVISEDAEVACIPPVSGG